MDVSKALSNRAYSGINIEEIVRDVKIFKSKLSKNNPLEGTFYRKKVLDQMKLNPKTGNTDYHGFPKIVDNYAKYGKIEKVLGRDGIFRTKISLKGSYKDKDGFFEWIVEPNNSINHRIFKIKN
ncbi:MAG: hypothetical protein K1060chlam5_00611 [Candidatus Anoxychlamydiales bacterium]|nr:hypothetical protein [Candidatus Anoxychlamydiales bacterium]